MATTSSTIVWGEPEPTGPRGPAIAYSYIGTSGDDFLQGDWHDNEIYGREGNDSLRGSQGNDRLIGNEGNDILRGGLHNDQMWGSDGNDIFVFGVDSGFDVIYDFEGAGQPGGDVILIDPALRTSMDVIMRDITYRNGNAIIQLDHFDFNHHNAAVTLTGIAPGSLTLEDFQWGFHVL